MVALVANEVHSMTHDIGLGFLEELVNMETFLGRRLTAHEIGLLSGPEGDSEVDPNFFDDSAQLGLLAAYISAQQHLARGEGAA